MPTFHFDDHIEPVIVEIGDEKFQAMPGIPADDFPEFMATFAKIPPLLTKLKSTDQTESLTAYAEFLKISIDGLGLVMLPESIERIRERAGNKERPVDATLLANIFSKLAGYYISGGKEAEDKVGEGRTDDASASSPSSEESGGSSEDNSSSEPPPSTDGPTTT